MTNLTSELKKVITGEILSDDATLEKYSYDASILKVKPTAIVSPKDVEDIKKLVKFATTEKQKGENISLTARSGGTDMSGGPLNDSIIVDFTKHFNRIESFNNETAIVKPGVFYRDFEKESKTRNLMIPSYPASKEICTVGGMVANNSGGEKTLSYGKTEKYVEELKVVLSNGEEYTFKALSISELKKKLALKNFEGEIYRKLYKLLENNYDAIQKAKPNVSKNSAGYYLWNVWDKNTFDIVKLIVGSQGTLGLITEIKFRLVPIKKHSRLAVVFLKNLDQLATIAEEILKFNPESFESYDDHTLKVALKFMPDVIKILKYRNAFRIALEFLPEFFMILTGGMPKLVMLIEIASDDNTDITNRLNGLKNSLNKFDVKVILTKNEAEAEKYWTIRRESFNLLRHRIKDRQTAPFIDDIIIRPEKLSEFLPHLNKILEPYGDKLIYTIAGHVGDGNFHIIPLMKLSDPDSRTLIPKISDEVYKLVAKFKGSITAEHNDGLIRTPYLKIMYSDKILELFKEVKNIFDPLAIFNPRKKVGGNIAYTLDHIK
jgi:FAD/FMN-containing dehydrogenase